MRGGTSGATTDIAFELRGEHIPLDALLKATGLAPSGGIAKRMIGAGEVSVDGREELRKTCKIRAGQRVRCGGATVEVHALAAADATPPPISSGV